MKLTLIISLFEKIGRWAETRGLANQDPNNQFLKIMEEFGELMRALLTIGKYKAGTPEYNEQKLAIADAIGDILVVLAVTRRQAHGGITLFPLRTLTDIDDNYKVPSMDNFKMSILLNKLLVDFYEKEYFQQYSLETLYQIYKCLNIIATHYYLNIEDCLSMAYLTINERAGKVVNGVFIKEEPQVAMRTNYTFFEDLGFLKVQEMIRECKQQIGVPTKLEWYYE